jgi:hypothetical protein
MILRMRKDLRRVGYGWLLLALFLSANTFMAAEHRGSFTLDCMGGVTFHMVGIDGLHPTQELVLISHGGGAIDWRVHLPEKAWKEVVGERCPGAGKCEVATSARIWIEKEDANGKSISGSYEVAFGEQRLEGQFVARFKKLKPAIECL